LDPHQYPTAGGRTLILRAAKALHSPFDTATVGAEDIMIAPYILFTSHRGERSGGGRSVEQPHEVYEGCRVRFVIPLLFRQHPTMRLAARRGLTAARLVPRGGRHVSTLPPASSRSWAHHGHVLVDVSFLWLCPQPLGWRLTAPRSRRRGTFLRCTTAPEGCPTSPGTQAKRPLSSI